MTGLTLVEKASAATVHTSSNFMLRRYMYNQSNIDRQSFCCFEFVYACIRTKYLTSHCEFDVQAHRGSVVFKPLITKLRRCLTSPITSAPFPLNIQGNFAATMLPQDTRALPGPGEVDVPQRLLRLQDDRDIIGNQTTSPAI